MRPRPRMWDEAWVVLEAALSELATAVGMRVSGVEVSMTRTHAAHFAFGGHAAFRRGGEPGDEHVVVSLDCQPRGSRLMCGADIATGDGHVLADGPTAAVSAEDPVPGVAAWSREVVQFVRGSVETVVRELNRAGTD